MNPDKRISPLRADIQALRAIAVVAVVICHIEPKWLPGGFLGVDMFFVISGFVITQILQKHIADKTIGQFWLQRLLRIVPAYIFMLATVVSVASIIFLNSDFVQFEESWGKSLIFLSNQYFAGYGHYFSPAVKEQPLLHTWSLSVEMQFYFFYPLFLFYSIRFGTLKIFTATVIIGFALAEFIWTYIPNSSPLYYSLLFRAPEFVMGGWLAVGLSAIKFEFSQRQSSLLVLFGIALITYCLVFFDASLFSPLPAIIIGLGVSMIVVADLRNGFIFNLLGSRVMLYSGALSYSIYLWHWPVLSFSRYIFGNIELTPLLILGYLGLLAFISWASYNFIEKKFRNIRISELSLAVKKLAILGLFAVAPFGYASSLNQRVPDLPIEFTRYADANTICHGQILLSCLRGDKVSANRVMLVGDSHAAQLNLAADIFGKNLGVAVDVITASSCMPLDSFEVIKIPIYSQEACAKQTQELRLRLADSKKIILAGMWSSYFSMTDSPIFLKKFFETSSERGQEVWVLAQVPKLARYPGRIHRISEWGIDLNNPLDSDWKIANIKLKNLAKQYKNVHFVDMSHERMFASVPFDRGILIYHDDHHLNEFGAKFYGAVLTVPLKALADK